MHPRHLPLLVLLLATALPGTAAAQTASGGGGGAAASATADDLHARHRPREAMDVLERSLASGAEEYGALWRAAREAVTLGMLTRDDEARDTWYRQAGDYAERAVAARPEGLDGRHWRAVATGRLADVVSTRDRVGLARRVREDALFILARDSLHAGAHHVLGEWNAEIMRLNGLTRFVARKLLGADVFDEASWDAARRHLARAVALEPRVLIHRLALARVLLDLGRDEEAREQLREVLERPAVDPVDPLLKQEAQEILRDR